jgi:retron-type reverse transcriptase
MTKHWRGGKWFIEGDIQQCFDSVDPTVLLSMLRDKLHDNRLLRLMANLFKAGYLEEWTYHPPLSGGPQGGQPYLHDYLLGSARPVR